MHEPSKLLLPEDKFNSLSLLFFQVATHSLDSLRTESFSGRIHFPKMAITISSVAYAKAALMILQLNGTDFAAPLELRWLSHPLHLKMNAAGF